MPIFARTFAVFALAFFASHLGAQEPSVEEAVASVLDDFHAAAARADFDRYFGHFAAAGVFIGTDATEHWTVEEFRAYARPHFDAGRGWTYVPGARHVYVSPDGRTAWFDELLEQASLGLTRGTGVLLLVEGRWRIAQYHLTIPVPNELAPQVVAMIRRGGA